MPILYDHLGNPINANRKPPTGRGGAVPIDKRTQASPTQFTTPESLKSAWASARRGDVRVLMQIGEEIEHDLAIVGRIRTRRLSVSKLSWEVQPASDDPQHVKHADFVAENIRSLKLRTAIEHFQDAVIKPFAVNELVWKNDGAKTLLEELHPRRGTEFTFDYATTGEQLRVITDPANPKGDPIDPVKFAVYRSRERGQTVMAEGGLLRGLAAKWLIKQHVMMWMAIGAERDGQPLRIGSYDPATATDDEIYILKQAIEQLGVDAGAVITKDMEIKIVEGMKNSHRDIFQVFIDILDREIAIGILGQVLSSSGGDQGSGSMALGTVHNEVKQDLLESDAANIGDVISDQVIPYIIIFNFGEQVAYPRLVLNAEPPEDLQSRATLDQSLQGMGFKFTHGYIAETYNRPLPEGVNEQDLLEPASSADPFGAPFTFSRIQTAHKKKL